MESKNSYVPRLERSMTAEEYALSPTNSPSEHESGNLEDSMEDIFEALGCKQRVSALLALHLEDKQRKQTSIGADDALLGGLHADALEYNLEGMYEFNEQNITAMCCIRTRSLPPRCNTILEPLFLPSLDSPSARSDTGQMIKRTTHGLRYRDPLLTCPPVQSDGGSPEGSAALPEISHHIVMPSLLSSTTVQPSLAGPQKTPEETRPVKSRKTAPPLQRVAKQGVHQMKQWQRDGLPPLRRLPKKHVPDNLQVPTPRDELPTYLPTRGKMNYSEIVQLGMTLQQPNSTRRRSLAPHAFSTPASASVAPAARSKSLAAIVVKLEIPEAIRATGRSRDAQSTPKAETISMTIPTGSVKDAPDTPGKTSPAAKKKTVLPGEWQEVQKKKSMKNTDALKKISSLLVVEDTTPPPSKKGTPKKTEAPKKASPLGGPPASSTRNTATPKKSRKSLNVPKRRSREMPATKKSRSSVASGNAVLRDDFEGMPRRRFTGINLVDKQLTILNIALKEYGTPGHRPTVSPWPVIVCFCSVVAGIACTVRCIMTY
eukprot:GEMP01021895.1.p1 GENE.GEMP01021895.1~~GEMP01021895.1.p1  ORF type:complete len:555 (+),score=111.57 GEMP01021895.1:34-1665(+)